MSDAHVVGAHVRRSVLLDMTKRRVFLDLYAGESGVAVQLRKQGFGCMTLEIRNGGQYDLTRPCSPGAAVASIR